MRSVPVLLAALILGACQGDGSSSTAATTGQPARTLDATTGDSAVAGATTTAAISPTTGLADDETPVVDTGSVDEVTTDPVEEPTTTDAEGSSSGGTIDATPDPTVCSPTGEGDGEIIVWHSLGTDARAWLDEATDAFVDRFPDRSVTVEYVGNYIEAIERLAGADPSELPDLVMADTRALRSFHDSGLFVEPSACGAGRDFDDLLPIVAETFSLDGQLAALPFNISTPVLYFDPAVMEAAGLDPSDPPSTLDELSEMSERIITAGATDRGLVAYDHYGAWWVTQFDAKRGDLTGSPGNGRHGEQVRAVDFTRPEVVEAYRWLVDEVESGRALWIGGNQSSIDDLLRLVSADDRAAFTINTSGAVGEVLRVVESGSFGELEVAIAPMPGPAPGGLAGGGAMWLVDKHDAARVGAAYELVTFLTEPARHAELAALTGYAPIREGEEDEPVLQSAWDASPQLRVGYDQLIGQPADDAHAGPAWGPGEAIISLLYATITRAVESGDVVGNLELASEQANALLAEYDAALEAATD